MVRWELGKGHGAQAEPLSTRRLLATGPLAASSDGAGRDGCVHQRRYLLLHSYQINTLIGTQAYRRFAFIGVATTKMASPPPC